MEFNVGEIKESTKVTTSIHFEPEGKVDFIQPSCGCMTVRYEAKAMRLYLSYSAGVLDKRTIETQGYQEIYKYVTVKYKDGSSQKINVKGRIIKK